MRCILMHKHLAVAELELDEMTGWIQKIYTVLAPKHLPVGVSVRAGQADRAALNEWWDDRSIPTSRSGVQHALDQLRIAHPKQLRMRCYGLSLSDQYWIKPQASDLTWDQINFFENPFSDDIGDILFGSSPKQEEFDFSSPDNTSDGCLKKRWKIIDGKRCLIKGGSNPFHQQPFNEVIATEIMKRLGIGHIPYTVVWNDGFPYSVCRDFVTADTELVAAWRIMQICKKDNSTSVYQHFIKCCEQLGAPDVTEALDRMLVLDYIIANEDRHFNNFGLLRKADTLEWLGMAPIYDSGSALGYDKTTGQIRSGRNVVCKPFKKDHEEQLKLVTTFDWICFDRLADMREVIVGLLSAEPAEEFLEPERIVAIADGVMRRIEDLKKIAREHRGKDDIGAVQDSVEGDVEENVAAEYGVGM